MDVNGTVATGYEAVRDAFAEAQKTDVGQAQLAVYRHGQPVVDLWTHDGDSLTVLMSATKGLTATLAHLLAERGQLRIDAPVSTYWPEFSPDVTVAQLLSHTAGFFSFDIGTQQLTDWDQCVAALASMTPLWQPGTAYRYHAITYGFLVGEVIRRVSGRSVGRLFAEEIGGPLGLDLWIGLPADKESRVRPVSAQNPPVSSEQMAEILRGLGVDLEHPVTLALLAGFRSVSGLLPALNTAEFHAAELPAANGIGNARSLARFYAALLSEVDGIRVLRPEAVEAARKPQTDGLRPPAPLDAMPDPYPLRHGLGFELARPGNPMLGPGGFGHAGAGGRLAFADPESGFSVGYTGTSLSWDPSKGPDPRWMPWLTALTAIT
ncbi:serine hydrolase domain-containing protein [Fodinicola acaciae]|uniref:serine hydrolase domain-containing protein n=1 Tax=Fodinicola acaciae TaxID=2681555 RepID=UPI0013CF5A97|nr:serine hydrolase domain-containing protein [Fodinicola acaciae]